VDAEEMKLAFVYWLETGAPSTCHHTFDERDTVREYASLTPHPSWRLNHESQ